jgi:nucleoside-diphosphate kinase
MEQSLLIIKPDAVKRGIIGEVLSRFEKRGFRMTNGFYCHPTPELLKQHYAEHYGKSYYQNIEDGMMSGPIFVFVLQGPIGTVGVVRTMLGKTDPLDSAPGTIRGDFALEKSNNVCHASDSFSSAEREIAIWFPNNC